MKKVENYLETLKLKKCLFGGIAPKQIEIVIQEICMLYDLELYTPVSSLHFFLLCPRGTLSTRIPDFGICISVPETSRKHQAALSFQDPHEPRYAIFGGISISMWMWSRHTSASIILIPFQLHSVLRMLPISLLFSPKNTFLLYFGANTT